LGLAQQRTPNFSFRGPEIRNQIFIIAAAQLPP
jgi:hypothetical protein